MNIEDIQDWTETKLAELKVEARGLIDRYFRESQDSSYTLKVWPRIREYKSGTFYLEWCQKDYVNWKTRKYRTKHVSNGRLSQAIKNCDPEEREHALSYEEKFRRIRVKAETVGKIMAQIAIYRGLE